MVIMLFIKPNKHVSLLFISTGYYNIIHMKKQAVFQKIEIYIKLTDFGRENQDLLVIVFKRSDLLYLFLAAFKHLMKVYYLFLLFNTT